MKQFAFTMLIAVTSATQSIAADPNQKVYTGVISESMCGITHTSMGISPDPKCIVECVKHGQGVRYVLVEEKTKALYTLSDQATPERFAAQRVRVTGTFYPKTRIIKVDSITPAK